MKYCILTVLIFFYFLQGLSQQIFPLVNKIPIDPKRWYQLNNATKGLNQLFDKELHEDIYTGDGKLIKYYESYYPILSGEVIEIDAIKLFDWKGVAETPTIIYAIDGNWKRTPIATFTGNQYDEWVGPNPIKLKHFKLDQQVKNIRYLMIRSGDIFPTEIEFYGNYKKPTPFKSPVKTKAPLSNFFGVNGYEWNFEDGKKNPLLIDEKKLAVVKAFTGFRHYLDWKKLEFNNGSYTYNPTQDGGWNYDAIYERCKKEGIVVLACLKTIPDWILSTYPLDLRNNENNPVKYKANLADLNSYVDQARLAFQFVARYGNNSTLNSSLVKVSTTKRWIGDQSNVVKIGMNLIKYIECENERDKWWKGRKAYQTAREYAANLSVFYDGHKNTMGAGIGVKNADAKVQVVMAGVALANTDYLRGMIDWCKEFRGYKKDGTINVCWDIINYHLYTNDPSKKRGIAPEKSAAGIDAANIAKEFVSIANQYLNGMPIWVTEAGYDINQGSPNKAIPISNKTALLTQADWVLRTSLLYSRNGIQKLFFYQLYDDTPNSNELYATSGLIKSDETRRPAADFLYQTNKLFGNFSYQKTLSQYPIIDQYQNNKGQLMYAIYIPDEKAAVGNCLLNLGESDSAYVYTPMIGVDNMKMQRVKTNAGKIVINATETPVFVTNNNN